MTTGGWFFMILSLAFVWSLAIWCYAKILRTKTTPEEIPEPTKDFHSA